LKIISDLKKTISIAHKKIGENSPVFIVAETGVTANGSVDIAKALIDEAKLAGADAVKFQTIDCDDFMSDKSVMYKYETTDGPKEENMYEMLKKHQFTPQELIEISDYAKERDIIFYLSVDSIRSVDWAEAAGSAAYKIGSWDLRNYPLIEKVISTGKSIQIDLGPVIIGEITQLVDYLDERGAKEAVLVYCSHASEIENLNLQSITYLSEALGIPMGYSADTRNIIPDVIAVTLGVKFIEKRLTISRNNPGHHHIKALEPIEFREWVQAIRKAEKALGKKQLKPSIEDLRGKSSYFTSIVATRDIIENETITKDMLCAKRPGTGISPLYIDQMIGRKTKRLIKENEVIQWEDWGAFA